MSVSLVGVVYNATTTIVQRIVIPEKGDGLEDQYILNLQKNPPTNCSVATVPMAQLPDYSLPTIINALQSNSGLPLLPPKVCVAVDAQGNIVNSVMADPIHTPVIGTNLIIENPHGAGKGDVWDGKNFQRTYSIADATGVVQQVTTLPLPQQPLLSTGQFSIINDPTATVSASVAAPTISPTIL